jgi:hypothetical protein
MMTETITREKKDKEKPKVVLTNKVKERAIAKAKALVSCGIKRILADLERAHILTPIG